jgi:hypothetical protein
MKVYKTEFSTTTTTATANDNDIVGENNNENNNNNNNNNTKFGRCRGCSELFPKNELRLCIGCRAFHYHSKQ